MERGEIHDRLRGTHDIARAAELLADNQDITYWQDTERQVPGEFDPVGGPEALRNANHLNCFEFVHLCNLLTCCQDAPGNLATDNFGNHLLDEPAGFNEWDGKSPIPRGSVVVGTTLPPFGVGANGIYHVGISVGGGQVVSNHSEGNVKTEHVDQVFGGLVGAAAYRVFYGPYPHCRCHETKEHHATHLLDRDTDYPLPATGSLHSLPDMTTKTRIGVEYMTRSKRLLITLAVGGTVIVTALTWASGLFGTTPQPTPLPTFARVTASATTATTAAVVAPAITAMISALGSDGTNPNQYLVTCGMRGSINGMTFHGTLSGPNIGSHDFTAVAGQASPVAPDRVPPPTDAVFRLAFTGGNRPSGPFTCTITSVNKPDGSPLTPATSDWTRTVN